jgi:hypothetical protein
MQKGCNSETTNNWRAHAGCYFRLALAACILLNHPR